MNETSGVTGFGFGV